MNYAKRQLQTGEIFCLQERVTGKWFAFQIVQVGTEWTSYVVLDYFGDQRPTHDDVHSKCPWKHSMRPLLKDMWNVRGELEYYYALTNWFPVSAISLGQYEIVVNEECHGWGQWPDGNVFRWLERWNQLPEDLRRLYRSFDLLDQTQVRIGTLMTRRAVWSIMDDVLAAANDFSELDQLPWAQHVAANRDYQQLIPFLERRPLIEYLEWTNHHREEMDLRQTNLVELKTGGASLKRLLLPDSCRILKLEWPLHPDLQIECCGEGFDLEIWLDLHDHPLPLFPLSRLHVLRLFKVSAINVGQITACYPHLSELVIAGKPGVVVDGSTRSLSQLQDLQKLFLEDMFGFTANDFPQPEEWQSLYVLSMSSIPKDTGLALRRLYKNKVADLHISKLRSPEWLAENLDNPFRSWDGREQISAAVFRKATAQWKQLRQSFVAVRLLPTEQQIQAAEEAVRCYTEAFNQLNRRKDFIETEEREEIFIALEQATNEIADLIDIQMLCTIFDEYRDF